MLFVADAQFAEQEQLQLQKAGFIAKEQEQLTPTHNLKFNSGIIYLGNNGTTLTLSQEHQCKSLRVVSNKDVTTTSSRGIVRQNLSTKD